jgi:hypothetical protein
MVPRGGHADPEDRRLAETNTNHGKDASISWRHLASQTSGYGLAETPGAAYSYNDFALALFSSCVGMIPRLPTTINRQAIRTRSATRRRG